MSFEWFRRFSADLGLYQIGRWTAITILVGAVAAMGAIAFDLIQVFLETHLLSDLANYHPPGHSLEDGQELIAWPAFDHSSRVYWAILLIPALGGLVGGLLVYLFAPEAEGHGTGAVIRAFHQEGGKIRPQVPIIKLLASAITIGTGGSAGREGPIAQIGAGFGSWLGTLLRLPDRERRTLLLAGVSAGVGAMFRAPLGGALFAAEVLYRKPEFEFEALIPCFMASILSYSLFCMYSGHGFSAIFSIPTEGMHFANPIELVLYGLVGIFLVLAGHAYIKALQFSRQKVFGSVAIPRMFKPALGGLFVGVLACFFPAILGVSYGYLEWPIWQQAPTSWAAAQGPILFFLLLGVLKIVATSLTIGSGGSGGVFAPSIVIGGSFGAAFGLFFGYLLPETVTHPGTFVLVGMGGFFSGVAKVPITSLIMVCEMTTGYGLVVPLMLVTGVTYSLTKQSSTLYPEQVPSRIDSPAHAGEFMIDILERVKVSEIMLPLSDVTLIYENTSLGEVLKISTQSARQTFPVMDEATHITGVVSLDDVRSYYYQSEMGDLIIAGDIIRPVEKIGPEDDLNSALQKLMLEGFEEYPVLSDEEEGEVVGLITRRDLLATYSRKFREMKDASG